MTSHSVKSQRHKDALLCHREAGYGRRYVFCFVFFKPIACIFKTIMSKNSRIACNIFKFIKDFVYFGNETLTIQMIKKLNLILAHF